MSLLDELYEELDEVAEKVARRYCRRCWWANFDDVKQDAWHAIVQATRPFDPDYGLPFEAYAMRAAFRWVRGPLWKESSPVSSSNLDKLRGLHRAPIEAIETHEAPNDPEREVALLEWRRHVAKIINHEVSVIDVPMSAVIDVITKERKAAEVASELNISVGQVYRAVARARDEIASSRKLYEEWREL